jgi:hypothetical protein
LVVIFFVVEECTFRVLFIEHGVYDDRHKGVEHVEELVDVLIVWGLTGEVVVRTKPELREHQHNIFEEVEQDKRRIAAV